MSSKFKIGDKVKLKSGSPEMTITKVIIVGEPKHVNCAWQENGQVKYGMFHEDALELNS